MTPPLVSIGIPLFRSDRFLRGLRANCEALAAEGDVEIIISDRHGLDDSLDTLRSEWGHDPRFRFLEATDGLNWVEHMNLLLTEARGQYFRWMPHDDLFPAGCLGPLVERLDRDPDIILAYAPTRGIDEAGRRLPERDRLSSYPVASGENWTFQHSLDLFWQGTCDGAFKGLFRRQAVMNAGLLVRPTYELILAERAWLFGVSLLGWFGEEPTSMYLKRYHPGSVHAGWHAGWRHTISATSVMCGYLRDVEPDRSKKWRGMVYLGKRAAVRIRQQLGE